MMKNNIEKYATPELTVIEWNETVRNLNWTSTGGGGEVTPNTVSETSF